MILNMSITASYAIIIVLVLRIFMKKMPKIYSYLLWFVVLFRLLCPISFISGISFLNATNAENTEYIPQDISMQQVPQINSGILGFDNLINPVLPKPEQAASINPLQVVEFVLQILWVSGVSIMLLYAVISYFLLFRKLRNFKQIEENIYEGKNFDTAFVFGIFKPKIFLPDWIEESEREYIIMHEKIHIKRFDHIVKIIAYIALSIHFFNPLVWLAYVLMAKDMEMSCDEAVIKKIGANIKKDYSDSLLSIAIKRKIFGISPIMFGESNIKSRIKNVLNYKSPKIIVSALLFTLITVCGFSLLSNPIDKSIRIPLEKFEAEIIAPAFWKDRYSVEYNENSSNYIVSQKDGGVLFFLTREKGDLKSVPSEWILGAYPGLKRVIYRNNYSYVFNTPTDVQAPIENGEAAVKEYSNMYESLNYIMGRFKTTSDSLPPVKNEGFISVGNSEFIMEVPKDFELKLSEDRKMLWHLLKNGKEAGILEFVEYFSEEKTDSKTTYIKFDENFIKLRFNVYDNSVSEELFNKMKDSIELTGHGFFSGVDVLALAKRYEQLGAERIICEIVNFEIGETNGYRRPMFINAKIKKLTTDAQGNQKLTDTGEIKKFSIENTFPTNLLMSPPDFKEFDYWTINPLENYVDENGKLPSPFDKQNYFFIVSKNEVKVILSSGIS